MCVFFIKFIVPVLSWAMLTAFGIPSVWINGIAIKWPINNEKLNIAQNYTFPGQLRVMAVQIIRTRLTGMGFLASFSDGSVTSSTSGWKCVSISRLSRHFLRIAFWFSRVGFNDSQWPKAVEFNARIVDGIDRKAKWIRGDSFRFGLATLCRKKF